MYLEVLAGGGAVAFAALLALIRGVARTSAAAVRSAAAGRGAATAVGVVAALVAMLVHGLVDSFLSFAPTYILFALTLGFAAALAGGAETVADAHRV
jgi:hypothetical protein